MQKYQSSDYEIRQMAINPKYSFLIQAPAGSGKTELLTNRILSLLAIVSKPEEILAITFTRKAAAEMRTRVLEKLKNASRSIYQTVNFKYQEDSLELACSVLKRNEALHWNLLERPERLIIRTIDSFCCSLINSIPYQSKLGYIKKISNDPWKHYEKAASSTLKLADRYSEVYLFLRHMDVNIQATNKAIVNMLGKRDQWLFALQNGFKRDSLQDALQKIILLDLKNINDMMPFGWNEDLSPLARYAAKSLTTRSGINKLLPLLNWYKNLPVNLDSLSQWKALSYLLLTNKNKLRSPKSINKNLGFLINCSYKNRLIDWIKSVDPDSSWIPYLGILRNISSIEFTNTQWNILEAQLKTLNLAAKQLKLYFLKTGEIDFIEVTQRILLALNNVRNIDEILLNANISIKHLLIDELQDTSQNQLALLKALTSNWDENDNRTIFLVGDPMQSIYRFRKAEVSLFLQILKNGIGKIKLNFLQLTDNFRSQAGIVKWTNHIFKKVFPKQSDALFGAIPFNASNASLESLPGKAVQFHPILVRNKNIVMEKSESAEVFTINLIRHYINKYSGTGKSIAILVRARHHLDNLVQNLIKESIPFHAKELVPLTMRPIVSDLVQLVRALMHPGDRLAWLSVLRSPFCGLTLNTMYQLFGHDHTTSIPILLRNALYNENTQHEFPSKNRDINIKKISLSDHLNKLSISISEYNRLTWIASILLDNKNKSGTIPLSSWIESLWKRLGGSALYTDGNAETDAEIIFQLIERLAPYGGLDLREFEDHIEKLFSSYFPKNSLKDPIVEIMTIHKSKGLQFSTVILYGLHHALHYEKASLIQFEQNAGTFLFGPIKSKFSSEEDPISNYLMKREKQRTDYEIDRLLYVATTRACEYLHLIGECQIDTKNITVKKPVSGSLLQHLWPHLKSEIQNNFIELESNHDTVIKHKVSEFQIGSLHRIPERHFSKMPPQFKKEPLNLELSANHIDLQNFRKQVFQLKFDYELIISSLIHKWLIYIGNSDPKKKSKKFLENQSFIIQKQLIRAGIPINETFQKTRTIIHNIQLAWSSDRISWIYFQKNANRKLFLIDTIVNKSIIDLVLETKNGCLLMITYKTDQLNNNETYEQFKLRMRYQYQDRFKIYCKQLVSLDGRAVKSIIYFLYQSIWLEL